MHKVKLGDMLESDKAEMENDNVRNFIRKSICEFLAVIVRKFEIRLHDCLIR